jgi:hypothetical protein
MSGTIRSKDIFFKAPLEVSKINVNPKNNRNRDVLSPLKTTKISEIMNKVIIKIMSLFVISFLFLKKKRAIRNGKNLET